MEVAKPMIGMIGVGNIGLQMVLRLLERGLNLTVCDRNPAAVAAAVDAGARAAPTPADLADACEVIVVSMPSVEASLDVALGTRGVVHGNALRAYVETSTLGSATVRRIAGALAPKGIALLDAPVSGGRAGARAGTLAIMASGAQASFDLARPALDALASKVFYLGADPGLGQIAKVINNHISAAGRLAVFEGLAMGIKAGLDPKLLNDIFNAGSARNYTTTEKVEAALLSGTFKWNNPLTIGLKDEALLLEEAEHCDAPLWLAPRILEVYREAAAAGYLNEDSMKVFLYMQSRSLHDAPGLRDGRPQDKP